MKKMILGVLAAVCLLSAAAQTQSTGQPARFRNVVAQESKREFSAWFRDAYLREFRRYKREHKQDYKYRKGDFRDCSVAFLVDTTGRPQMLYVTPAELSAVQMEVLHATFDASPDWEPGVKDGHKVKTRFTLPIRE